MINEDELREEDLVPPDTEAVKNMIRLANKAHMFTEVAEAFLRELRDGKNIIEATRNALCDWGVTDET